MTEQEPSLRQKIAIVQHDFISAFSRRPAPEFPVEAEPSHQGLPFDETAIIPVVPLGLDRAVTDPTRDLFSLTERVIDGQDVRVVNARTYYDREALTLTRRTALGLSNRLYDQPMPEIVVAQRILLDTADEEAKEGRADMVVRKKILKAQDRFKRLSDKNPELAMAEVNTIVEEIVQSARTPIEYSTIHLRYVTRHREGRPEFQEALGFTVERYANNHVQAFPVVLVLGNLEIQYGLPLLTAHKHDLATPSSDLNRLRFAAVAEKTYKESTLGQVVAQLTQKAAEYNENHE